ncbi:MAG: 3-isopropylmalate dehydratase small subunit [Spirochaetota bacterium]
MEKNRELVFEGKTFKFGDNIDTDAIIPARYLNTLDPDELAAHCMEDLEPHFTKNISRGDIIVAGENFGCGSSREHAPIAIKACGVSCIIASSFARIFYRNAINIGLPILESQQASMQINSGETVSVNLHTGTIVSRTTGKTFKAGAFPEFMQNIINAGGLINATRQMLEGKG